MNIKLFLTVLAAVAGSASAVGLDFETRRDIRYSDAAERCVLDVRWPRGVTNYATVVNFHGGGLVAGGKHFAPWPAEAKDRDPVAFVAVNYRLMKAGGPGPADCLEDAAAAVAWTLDHIAEYGGSPKKVFVTGISGGGYLTAMLGLDARWLAKHGHKPGDLAGIAPLTGQMTKHFNVRKIGFADNDPQFAPKIDAWAPLAYAGAKDLPPACFLAGGRDVEWKCRVEENELLAASLRSCGYPRTEFHETEGDHGGGRRASAYFLRDFVLKHADTGAVARFAPGEQVAFCGDSITHDGRYVYYLQLFQDLRHPGSGVRLHNLGRSGDSADGGARRFSRDVMSVKPDRAFVMFGMNDIGRDNWKNAEPSAAETAARARSVDFFRRGTRALADKLAAAGVKTVMITPSPFDQYGAFAKENIPFCNDPGLATCARIVRELASARNLGLVEFHAPMTELFRAQAKGFHFCPDRVHPGNEGHLVMAAHVLAAMAESPVVARVAIDAAKGAVARLGGGETENVRVTALRASPQGVAFTYAPKALPFPKLPEYEKADGAFYPLTERFNRETLKVTGLEPGNYALAFDGRTVATFSAEALARGVNLALLDTPNQRRAAACAVPMRALQATESKRRRVVLVELMLTDAKVDAKNRAAADAWLDKWLAERRTSPWYGGVKAWVESYREGRDGLPAAIARAQDLYEEMAAVRPAVSRVTLVRVADR